MADERNDPEGRLIAVATRGDVLRIGIVDDHPVGRVALREALSQQDGVVVQWDARSDEAHARVAVDPVDVVLVDVGLTDLTDAAGGRRVLSGPWPVPVVIVSADASKPATFIDPSGRSGRLVTYARLEDLVTALRRRLGAKPRRGSGGRGRLGRLSRREAQVLGEVRAGRTNREIATRLEISVATVNKHVHKVLLKLGARNRAQAASLAATETKGQPPK